MMNMEVCPAAGGEQVLDLDPDLWKKLPEELLDKTICKLPFSSLVAFRVVSKEWYGIKVPLAARHIHASELCNRRPALLLFVNTKSIGKSVFAEGGRQLVFHGEQKLASSTAWWVQLSDKKDVMSESGFPKFQTINGRHIVSESVMLFQMPSFPQPSQDEYALLQASEGGLLFFGFIHKLSKMLQDFVVCNPLTGKSKRLQLPCPLRTLRLRSCAPSVKQKILVGVAHLEMGSYQLVVGGSDGFERYPTFVYESSSGTWTNYPSILMDAVEAVVGNQAREFEELITVAQRSVYCNGNLYWFACVESIIPNHESQAILKFDMAAHIWTVIELPIGATCPYSLQNMTQIALHKGEILLWHIHQNSFFHRRNECSPDCNYRGCVAQYCKTWTSDDRSLTKLRLHPELKLMSSNMNERLEEILDFDDSKLRRVQEYRRDYTGFSQGGILYHVVGFQAGPHQDGFLRIVTQDDNDMSFTEFTLEVSKTWEYLESYFVWAFLPSLISAP